MINRIINRLKNKLFISRLKSRGLEIVLNARIDRSVDMHNPNTIRIGESSILYKQVSIYPGKSGSFSLGDHSHIAPFGYLLIDNNHLSIGNHVAIGPFCTLVCHSNSIHGKSNLFAKNYLDGNISIGNNVFIGAQCTILPGTQILDNVVVAANSVVNGQLESGWVYGGTPAKKLKQIEDGES
jgi:galactoside O-acetyltransferase